jgi:hypothetical protein
MLRTNPVPCNDNPVLAPNAETAGKPLTKKEDGERKKPGKKRLKIGRIKR